MKNIIILILQIISCANKPEIIESKTNRGLFLLKNPKFPKDSSFLFYQYTRNTKYFINNNEDPSGFSSEELINYPEDEISDFFILKCKSDSTKLVGDFIFMD